MKSPSLPPRPHLPTHPSLITSLSKTEWRHMVPSQPTLLLLHLPVPVRRQPQSAVRLPHPLHQSRMKRTTSLLRYQKAQDVNDVDVRLHGRARRSRGDPERRLLVNIIPWAYVPLLYLNGPRRSSKIDRGQPVFHEGTKYNACCPKRKTLEFDEFMKIQGCKTGSHLFVGAKKDEVRDILQLSRP